MEIREALSLSFNRPLCSLAGDVIPFRIFWGISKAMGDSEMCLLLHPLPTLSGYKSRRRIWLVSPYPLTPSELSSRTDCALKISLCREISIHPSWVICELSELQQKSLYCRPSSEVSNSFRSLVTLWVVLSLIVMSSLSVSSHLLHFSYLFREISLPSGASKKILI